MNGPSPKLTSLNNVNMENDGASTQTRPIPIETEVEQAKKTPKKTPKKTSIKIPRKSPRLKETTA